jgi:hypothetical protein
VLAVVLLENVQRVHSRQLSHGNPERYTDPASWRCDAVGDAADGLAEAAATVESQVSPGARRIVGCR